MEHLTRDDIVALWVGSNDVARNNSMVGMKHILDLLINSTHTNVILISVPHRYDLIKGSCINREVGVFNRSLENRLKSGLIHVVYEREFYTKHRQHLNLRGKENMASRIAHIIDSMIKRKVDPIHVKWYNDAVTDSQKCQNQDTHEKTGFDGTTTNAVQSANIIKERGYPVMFKASDGDTALDKENGSLTDLSCQQTQHSESINCTSKGSNSEAIITETNRSSNCTRKIQATRSNNFLWEN